ncbi:MAG: molybdenum cofactor guanylyltransferase [Verrucomicrobiota bacterium]
MPPIPLTAVLLAGGSSSRMGSNKASLLIQNQPLFSKQLATLQSLNPTQILISGPPDGPYAHAGFPIVPDILPHHGPLSGLQATLRLASTPLLLLLAVDLPAITPEFLSLLIHKSASSSIGCVPKIGQFFEPLAAIYPQSCLPMVEACLHSDDHSMQHFIQLASTAGLLEIFPIPPPLHPLFHNLNHPHDLSHFTPKS